MTVRIETERLLLRDWCDADLAPFAALNADPEAMAFFPALLDRAASDALAGRLQNGIMQTGYGFYAVEVKDGAPFIGFVGLAKVGFAAAFAPTTEIGWRLARVAWGHGYASEAARACLSHGFETIGLDEIVSFAAQGNRRSIAVMERIGMRRDQDGDFDHPLLPAGHPLARHVLYRAVKPDG